MSKAKKKGVKVNLADFMGADSRDALPTAPSGLTELPRGPGAGGVWRGSAGRSGDLPRGPRRDRGGDDDNGEEEEWRRFQKGKPSEDEGPSRADEADQWRRGPSSSSSSSGAYQARGGSRYGDRDEMGERRRGFGDRERRDDDGGPPPARADEAAEWRRSAPLESDRPSRFGSGRDDRYGGPRDGGDRPRYGDRSSHFSSSRESTGEREFSRDMFGTAKVEERPRFGDRDRDREGGSRFGSSFSNSRFGDRDRDRDHHGREERSERPRLNLQKRTIPLDGSESKSESQATSQVTSQAATPAAGTPTAGTPPPEAADEKPEAAKSKESTPETAKENIKEPSRDTSDAPSKPKPRIDIFGRNLDEPKMTASGGPALAPIPGRALKKNVDPSTITATSTTRTDPFGAARRAVDEPKKTTTKPTEPTPAPKPHIPREVDESLVKEAVPIAQKRSALQKAMNDSEPVTEKQLNEGLARLDLTDTDVYVDLINCLVRSITDKKIAMSLETLHTSLSQHQKEEQADIMCDVLVALRTKKDRETMLNWIKSSPKTPILPIIAGDRKDADLDAFLTSKDLIELKPVPDLTDAIVTALNDNKSSDAVVTQINASADEKVSVDYLIAPVVSFLSSRIYADKSKPDATCVTTYASLLKRVAGTELSHQKRLLYEFQLHWNNAGTPKTILKETFNALLTSKIIPIDAFIAWKEDTSDKGKNGKTKALLQVNSWIEEHTPKPKEEEEDDEDEDEEEEDDEDGYDD